MNRKIYAIGFYILLVVNIAIVTIFLLKPKGQDRMRNMRQRVSKELGLTESQRATFSDLAEAHREKIRDLDAQEADLIKTYFDAIVQPQATSSDSILNAITGIKEQKILTTYAHFEAVKELCGDENQVNFERFYNRVMPMLTGSGRRGVRKPR